MLASTRHAPRHTRAGSTSRPLTASRASSVAATLTVALVWLTGCVANAPMESATGVLSVTSTATECTLSARQALEGTVVFRVTNTSEAVTEFYLLAADNTQIVGEVENIGPGLSRDLVVDLPAGEYFTTCKSGSGGLVIGGASFTARASGTNSGSGASDAAGVSAVAAAQIDAAVAGYERYVRDQVAQLVTGTTAFATAYTARDDVSARTLYVSTRVHWERIETVAESFGTLDATMDLREADLEEGQPWTGWHAMEKDLWPEDAAADFTAYSTGKRAALAAALVTDTASLATKIQDLHFSLDQLSNGAIGLLDEVASSKVTGEEELWSHTDLSDFGANVEGARVLYTGLRTILVDKDAALARRIDLAFAELDTLLATHRLGHRYVSSSTLSTAEIRALSDRVNALAEPLSGLTAALLQ
jgi:iron uptake system component EfeO